MRKRQTMTLIINAFTILAVGGGLFFFLAGAVALLRFPDSLTRLHALTKADSLGLGLIVLGLLPQSDGFLAAAKLLLVWAVAQLGGATLSQLVGRIIKDETSKS
jgi:multicomponent Na+:H+ antiporter subunit G